MPVAPSLGAHLGAVPGRLPTPLTQLAGSLDACLSGASSKRHSPGCHAPLANRRQERGAFLRGHTRPRAAGAVASKLLQNRGPFAWSSVGQQTLPACLRWPLWLRFHPPTQLLSFPLPDSDLQRACMAVPGGAVLFASVNGVHLETPSELQKQAAKQVRAL